MSTHDAGGAGGTRGRTSRASIVSTAVAIVDRHGLDALTIRRLAGECGVTPMAIYRHVHDKDELVDLVVETVVGELGEVELSGDWRSRALGLFGSFRRVMRDHPGVAMAFVDRPSPTPAVLRITNQALEIAHDAGFRGRAAVRAYDTMVMFTIGSLVWELPRSGREREALVRLALHTTYEAPFVVEYASDLAQRDADEQFRYGFETVLRGLEAHLADLR